MSSRMVNCQYCNRLYTQYSLPLHQPKCQENPWVARLSPTGRSARPDWMTTSRRPTTRSMSRPTGDVCSFVLLLFLFLFFLKSTFSSLAILFTNQFVVYFLTKD
uniref:Uncharacterized protein n=1 Tax=Angiostrongylus cantonensis TaxID=6313 RepID=A0A0K0D7V1_ANGCA